MRISLLSVVAVAFVFGTVQAEDVKVDPKLPEYKAVSGVSGNLSSIGSDTLNNLMTLWAEGFRKYYPNVKVQIQGKGSGTAPPALIEGTAQFGPMSRAMKSSEIDKFEEKFGFRPLQVGVAIDSLEDMERLFANIPLDRVSTSMTINATAAWLLALYAATAERQGVESAQLSGTTQNDIIKEYLSRGTYVFPPEASMRLISDMVAYTCLLYTSPSPRDRG